MKIYNKKMFAFGIFSLALGLCNLILALMTKPDVSGIVLIVALFLFGGISIVHGLSKKLSKEDKLLASDERNQYVEAKAKTRAFQILHYICFGLMALFLVIGKATRFDFSMYIGVGLGIAWFATLWVDLLTHLYYDSRI